MVFAQSLIRIYEESDNSWSLEPTENFCFKKYYPDMSKSWVFFLQETVLAGMVNTGKQFFRNWTVSTAVVIAWPKNRFFRNPEDVIFTPNYDIFKGCIYKPDYRDGCVMVEVNL